MKPSYKPEIGMWPATAAGILLLATSLGCATVQPARPSAEMASPPKPAVTLRPGNVIDLKFFYNPEFFHSFRVLGVAFNRLRSAPLSGQQSQNLRLCRRILFTARG